MPRVLASVSLVVGLVTGCGGSPPARWFAGWPRLPATLVVDVNPPDLPPGGPLGRGALVLSSPVGVVLVLEDARQFRLPPPPPAEGRQGRTFATVSPDGRWLAHRQPGGERRYLIRDLLGDAVVHMSDAPLRWSPDARYLIAGAPPATPSMLVEPATGDVRPLDDGDQAVVGALADGLLLGVSVSASGLRLAAGSTVREVPLGAPPDHECWCPAGATVSPGLDAVSVLLRYESGIVAGTSQKSRPMTGNPTALVVYDRESGAARHRVVLPAGEDHVWSLLADTGDGILVRRQGPDGDELVLVNAATGALRTVMRPPADVVLAVPGQVLADGV